MANNAFAAIRLTGGTAGCLDDIIHTNLTDGDMAFITDKSGAIAYTLYWDSSSTASEDTTAPGIVIIPDSAPATGRWLSATINTELDLDFICDSGGAKTVDFSTETLTVEGGTGIDTTGSAQKASVAIDSTVATLAGSQTLTNKTLTSPVVNTPTGIVKGDVGLGNVDNTSDATKDAASAILTNKTLTSPVIAEVVSGSSAADFTVTTGADKTLVLATPVWEDLIVSTAAVRLGGASAATEVAYKGGLVAGFGTGSDQNMYFTFQLPHAYKIGTDVEFHIHWTIAASGAGAGVENVEWLFTSSACSPNLAATFESWPTATDHAALVVDVQNITADNHMATEIATLTGTNFLASEVIICSLQRNVDTSDDYGDAAYVVQLDLHYQVDTMGSRTEWAK